MNTLSPSIETLERVQPDSGQKLDENVLFPVFLKLENFHTLLVGAGNVGLEKLSALLQNSPEARISVVASHVCSAVAELITAAPNVELFQRDFQLEDLRGISFAILATDDPRLHETIYEYAAERGIIVNVADTPALCDAYLGSVVRKGNLKIAISTNGQSPTMAKRLKEIFNETIPIEINTSLSHLHQIRNRLKGDFNQKVQYLNGLTSSLVAAEKPKSTYKGLRFLLWTGGSLVLLLLFALLWNQEPEFQAFLMQVPAAFYWFLTAGFAFALIDGAIGMSYGVTSTTFSLSMGIPPASASMAVHVSEIVSNGVAGWMHYRLKNVNKALFKSLVIPGIIGSVLGAALLSVLHGYAETFRLVISFYTLYLGLLILRRAWRAQQSKIKKTGSRKLTGLGLGGGFMDAVGGGGWGSIVLSSLIAGGRNPRYALGSVKLSRFFIALFSTLTFLTLLEDVYWYAMAGLVLGSLAAAPIAVRLSHKFSVKVLMILVGILVIGTSLYTLLTRLL